MRAPVLRSTASAAGFAVALLVAASGAATPARADAPDPPSERDSTSKFFSREDGWFDVSGFMNTRFGFLPLAVPITEPAVGYGAAGGVFFVDKPLSGLEGKPDITFVGGMGTENGTRGLVAANLHQWRDGRLQTFAAFLNASVNLDFFGLGSDVDLEDHPLRYNFHPAGGTLQGKQRLGDLPVMAGLGYTYAKIKVEFDEVAGQPVLLGLNSETHVASLTPVATFDTRDNIFTATRGSYLEASCALYSEAFGGDENLQVARVLAMQYFRPGARVYLGFRADAKAAYGDVPFYLVPFVQMRGIPMLRYQGERVAQGEAEVRWQFWGRVSGVGFGGAGAAHNEFTGGSRTRAVGAGGVGLRYEIAREFGIHAGIDVARGPDVTAIYIQLGSAWARP